MQEDRSIKLRDLNTSQCINTLIGHTKEVRCLIQLNDNMIASCSFDKRIKLWDLKTNKNTVTLKGHESWVLALIKLNNLSVTEWFSFNNYDYISLPSKHTFAILLIGLINFQFFLCYQIQYL